MMGVWKVMRLAILFVFSKLDQDGTSAMLLPEVCLAVNTKVNISHSMCVLVGAEPYFIHFKAKTCDRILCEAQKKR
jgi:hypothetical protein